MTYRTDKFKIGDKVVWDESMMYLGHWLKKENGEGPFILTLIEDVENEQTVQQSLWDDMGHTQMIGFINNRGHSTSMSAAWLIKCE